MFTQWVVNAVHADEVITGSFVNAKAIAAYIRSKAPAKVTLVCMGKEGITLAEEDELCAIYIEGLLTGRGMPDIDEKLRALRNGNGKHFFDPCRQADFPEKDFWMCIDRDKFDFVLKAEKDSNGYLSRMIPGTGFPG